MRQTGLQNMCCVARDALLATPACLRRPNHHQAAVWLSGTLPPSWDCASRWQGLSGAPLLRTLGGSAPSQFPWTWVSRPEATRKAATGPSGRPGPEARKQVARPRQAGDTGPASLQPGPSGQTARPVAGLLPGPGGARGRGGACVPGPGLSGRMAAAARSPPR